MDLSAYRASAAEQGRIADLLQILPTGYRSVLDIGARDGYISGLLCERFADVTALDLEMPRFEDQRVVKVEGDVTQLQFENNSFDVVLCAEVLEHIPEPNLSKACREIARVARCAVVVGVPYRQDLRFGRTVCQQCGAKNPPWGHINSFDETRLRSLFEQLKCDAISFVGTSEGRTNAVSSILMDYAGNPYGTYVQEEPCVQCGGGIGKPVVRTFSQKIATRMAMELHKIQMQFARPQANWIHARFVRMAI